MKLTEFIKIIQTKTQLKNPDIKVLDNMTGQVCEPDIVHRSGYFNETLNGNDLAKGDYFIIEAIYDNY